jgi:AcrR family transcriptional regulator
VTGSYDIVLCHQTRASGGAFQRDAKFIIGVISWSVVQVDILAAESVHCILAIRRIAVEGKRLNTAQRRVRAKEDRRRAILDAARELFVTEDYRAVSIRRIAEKVGYSPMTIYLYFKDKQEILLHLVDEGFVLLDAQLERLEPAVDPLERLRSGGQVYLEFALAHPHYYKIMFQLEDQALTDASVARSEAQQRAFDFIRQCVDEAQAQGRMSQDRDGDVVAYALWAGIHGAASLALTGRLSRLPQEAHPAFFAAVIDITLKGLIEKD